MEISYFRVITPAFTAGTEENHRNPRQDSQSICRDLNPVPPKHEVEVLIIQLRRSMQFVIVLLNLYRNAVIGSLLL
jgi:hypothetical protein